MQPSDILIGTKFGIEMKDVYEDDSPLFLISRLLGFENDIAIYIEQPFFKGTVFPFRIGDKMLVYFTANEELYSFNASFSNYEDFKGSTCAKLKFDSKLEAVQRRNYYRLKCFLPIKIRVIMHESPGKKKLRGFFSSILSDISGGGIRASVDENFEKGDKLECLINLSNFEASIQGEVIWVRNHRYGRNYKYDIGVKFEFVDKKVREEIIRYIFEQQRKLIRRERQNGES